jgi:hypothetical protein
MLAGLGSVTPAASPPGYPGGRSLTAGSSLSRLMRDPAGATAGVERLAARPRVWFSQSSLVGAEANQPVPPPPNTGDKATLSLEMHAVQEAIAAVEKEIARTQREIEDIKQQLKNPLLDSVDKPYLLRDKEQLRDEENKLIDKEKQLREEKLKLIDKEIKLLDSSKQVPNQAIQPAAVPT